MSAAAVAKIDLAALRHNFFRARSAAPHSRVLAVVKGNAYGHGSVAVARTLSAADGLAVARVEEAIELREAGIDGPLLVLGGFHDGEDLRAFVRHGLQAVVHAPHQIELLERVAPESDAAIPVWLKVDTGMHRLGFPVANLAASYARIEGIRSARIVCIMTHFAAADDPEDPFTASQIKRFRAAMGDIRCAVSMANSAGLLGFPDCHGDWVRPGIMLYGASPFRHGNARADGLEPVMTFGARLVAIREVEAGAGVGYGGIWTARRTSRIGVVAAGYGDGYPREAPNGTPVLVAGVRVPLAGRVSMDLLTVDLTAHPGATVGDPVVLWGEGLPVEDVGGHMGTVPYALFCGITSRTRFEYVDDPAGPE